MRDERVGVKPQRSLPLGQKRKVQSQRFVFCLMNILGHHRRCLWLNSQQSRALLRKRLFIFFYYCGVLFSAQLPFMPRRLLNYQKTAIINGTKTDV